MAAQGMHRGQAQAVFGSRRQIGPNCSLGCRLTSEHCSSMQAPQPSSGCREAFAASGNDALTARALQYGHSD